MTADSRVRQANALDHFRRLFELTEADQSASRTENGRAERGDVSAYQEIHGDNPGEPSAWSYHKALHRAASKVA